MPLMFEIYPSCIKLLDPWYFRLKDPSLPDLDGWNLPKHRRCRVSGRTSTEGRNDAAYQMCGPKPKGENVEGFLFTKKERVNDAHPFPSQASQVWEISSRTCLKA